jgi:hypothetical protein
LKYEQCYLIYDFNRLEAFRGQKWYLNYALLYLQCWVHSKE